MKRRISWVLIVVFCLSIPLGNAQATSIEEEGTALRKLQRGFLNVVLSPVEISTELAKEKRKDTLPPSWFAGLVRGSLFMLGRAVVGVIEIATFPIPLPSNYKPILQPEFAWQHLPE